MKDFLCGTALIEATIDQEVRIQAEVMLTSLVRWLAKKQVRDQWRAMGRNVNRCNPIELQMAANIWWRTAQG